MAPVGGILCGGGLQDKNGQLRQSKAFQEIEISGNAFCLYSFEWFLYENIEEVKI